MINITGLWKHKDKNGNLYLSGKLGNAKIFIFQTKEKRTEKSPDYNLVVAPPPDRDFSKKDSTPEPNDDIPF